MTFSKQTINQKQTREQSKDVHSTSTAENRKLCPKCLTNAASSSTAAITGQSSIIALSTIYKKMLELGTNIKSQYGKFINGI